MSTLVQVQSVSAQAGVGKLRAQMNAQFGAMIALGDLQRLAGPDQRVTARSDILLPAGANPPEDEESVDRQIRWTGVWSSNANPGVSVDTDDGLDAQQAHWLVSGHFDPANLDAPSPDPFTGLNPAQSVELARVGGSVASKAETVRVPTVAIPSSGVRGEGQFAYWVGDEGIKARINLEDPYDSDNLEDDEIYYRSAIAQQGDPSAARNSSGSRPFAASGRVSSWKDDSIPLTKLTTAESLSFLSDSTTTNPVGREFFHDFTTHSRSVLANTKDGGLRRDLSSALRDLPGDLRGPIFPPVGGAVSPGNPGGPKWEQLADYFTLSDSVQSGSVNFRLPTSDQVGFAPVVTRFNFIIQVFAEELPTASANRLVSDYSFTLGIFPLITLWNPYAHDLVIPDLGLQSDMRAIKLMDSPTNGSQIGGNLISPRYVRDQNRPMIGFTIASTTIPAGQAINFTPPNNSYISTTSAEQNVLKAGASGQLVRGFFTVPITLPTNTTQMYAANGQVQICMGCQNPLIWDHVFNLYESPDMDPDQRFLALTVDGFGDVYRNHNWHSPRVIMLSDLTGGSVASPTQPRGSSRSASWMQNTDFDLEEFDQFAHNVTGSTAILNLPRSAVNNVRDHKVHFLSQMNPRAPMAFEQMHWRAQPNNNRKLAYRLYGQGEIPWWKADNERSFLAGTDELNAHIGLGNDFTTNGSDKMVLFDVPDQVPLSIGQFMHANLMNIDSLSHTFPPGQGQGWSSNLQQPHTTPAYAIGNSAPNIHLPLDQTRLNITNNAPFLDGYHSVQGYSSKWQGAHYDYSYELNNALWDPFFLSTVDPGNSESRLPNARMVPWKEAFPEDDLEEEQLAAAHLVLEGGFNINSTSVAAWEGVLGALRDVATLGELASVPSLQVHNLSRFISPVLQSTPNPESISYRSDKDTIVAGFRALTDDQISSLSEQVVEEVRRRSSARGHPFRSLSEFVNRSIDPVDIGSPSRRRFAFNGPLQFAIDQSGMNGSPPAPDENGEDQDGDGLWEDDYLFTKPNQDIGPYHPEVLESVEGRPLIEGAPGFLTQADILAKIGPILNARSDTFTIRGYGTAPQGLSDDSPAVAYCELVVQRTPAYVDSLDADHEVATSSLNRQFGRRFELVRFRWMEEDEI